MVQETGDTYGFADEDPVNGSDPTGLMAPPDPACGGNGPPGDSPAQLAKQCATELQQTKAMHRQECANGTKEACPNQPSNLSGKAGLEGLANWVSGYVNTAATAPNAFSSLFGLQIPEVPCFHGSGLGTSYKLGVASLYVTPVGGVDAAKLLLSLLLEK